LLKKLLVGVLKGYPGVTVGLQRLEFTGKFEPLIHRWPELQNAVSKLDEKTEKNLATKIHTDLLMEVLRNEFKSLIETSQDMKSKGVMTYEHLWTLFQPGATVYTRNDGQETAMLVQETKYGVDSRGAPCFWVTSKIVAWDGTKFGTQKLNLSIPFFNGTRQITQLKVFPIEYHSEPEALRKRLIERGEKAESLAGPHYRAYNGVAWKFGQYGTKDKYNVKGRVRQCDSLRFFANNVVDRH
jgi:hypothetical protein